AFTVTTLLGLEGYGFCGRGEGKDFVADGALSPGGRLPVNTGGGQLSGYYLQGMTQVSEGYLQAAGRAGDRQVEKNGWSLVTAQGGRMDYHACLILSPEKVR
ncbi:thiolase C-terminal domain-containing protein, partial [Hyphococcus sp.]|uniref:thiolase C-terminal domain-containing protein n=1 Tax=Hyphococcus sp. TaxID=2038636 RepID=UPI004047939C